MTMTDTTQRAIAAGLIPPMGILNQTGRPKRTPEHQARIDRMASARAEGKQSAKETALAQARAARRAKRTPAPAAPVQNRTPARNLAPADPEQQLWDRVRGEQPDIEPTKAEADTLRSIWSNTTEQDPADTELYRSVYGS